MGFDADGHGDFAYFDGIQLQIFDVSELSNPTLLHKTTIGTRGSTSEGLTNHLAFDYFPSKGLLALPMSACSGGASFGAGFSCSNWWASSTSDVKHSIFMDEYAIGISDSQYRVAPLSDLSGVLESVPLGNQ